MNKPLHVPPTLDCAGPLRQAGADRRTFLKLGLSGFAGLTLPDILRLQAASPLSAAEGSSGRREKNAVIMVWQPGGCSHIDSYDPKPSSGSEYRGPFDVIDTKVPGLQFTELLPRQAAIADKFTVLRSMSTLR